MLVAVILLIILLIGVDFGVFVNMNIEKGKQQERAEAEATLARDIRLAMKDIQQAYPDLQLLEELDMDRGRRYVRTLYWELPCTPWLTLTFHFELDNGFEVRAVGRVDDVAPAGKKMTLLTDYEVFKRKPGVGFVRSSDLLGEIKKYLLPIEPVPEQPVEADGEPLATHDEDAAIPELVTTGMSESRPAGGVPTNAEDLWGPVQPQGDQYYGPSGSQQPIS